MADIAPNIVVSMPSQIFTQRREFKSCSNGKIYIGKIDTDPLIPENQIQVYLENEDGKYTPVAQPIIIGTGGYPVYNGQIAKFVTEEGHAMAVYDGDGVQQFYFPNVLKYEPKKAIKELYDALNKKFDKTGGTVNGDVIVEGSLTLMKGDDRKHFCIQNQDGRARMWLYKDKGGDGIHLNNGEDGGGDWLFHKNGNFHAPAGIVAGGNVTVSWGGRTATFHENGDVSGPLWGGALSGYIHNTFVKKIRLGPEQHIGFKGQVEYHGPKVVTGFNNYHPDYTAAEKIYWRPIQFLIGNDWIDAGFE